MCEVPFTFLSKTERPLGRTDAKLWGFKANIPRSMFKYYIKKPKNFVWSFWVTLWDFWRVKNTKVCATKIQSQNLTFQTIPPPVSKQIYTNKSPYVVGLTLNIVSVCHILFTSLPQLRCVFNTEIQRNVLTENLRIFFHFLSHLGQKAFVLMLKKVIWNKSCIN